MAGTSNSTTSSKSTTFLAVALAVAILYFGRQIFIPLALALVFSFLLTPLVGLLERCRLGRIPAVLVVLGVCFALAGGVGWEVAGQLVEITANIRDYKANLQDKIQSLHASKDGALVQATTTVRELSKELTAASAGSSATNESKSPMRSSRPIPVQVTAPPSNLLQDLRVLLGPLAGPLQTGAIVIIFTAFMLIKREDLRNRLIRLGGQGQLSVMTQALDDATRRLSRYLLLQFLVNAAYGLLFGVGLYFIGVPHALLWGVLGSLLRFVPYIGTLVATAFPLAISLAVFPGWRHAVLTFGLFLVLELIISNIIEPWLYGTHTGISALAILVAAVFWTMLWGPVGLILSTPLTVCLMLVGRYVSQLSFLEVLLGDEPVLRPEELFYQRLLASDLDEARNLAEAHVREKPLDNLYETVLIPALRLAEQDRHMGIVDDRTSEFIYQSTRELIEDLGDRFAAQDAVDHNTGQNGGSPAEDAGGRAQDRSEVIDSQLAKPAVVCLPARDEADELVGMMLAQLLERTGNDATFLPIGTVDDMLEKVSRGGFRVTCISALPPFAVGQARSLCRRLRKKMPGLSIVVGLWNFTGGVPKAQERVGSGCTDAVATSLPEALLQIRRLLGSVPANQFDTSSECTSTADRLSDAHQPDAHEPDARKRIRSNRRDAIPTGLPDPTASKG